MRLTSTPPHINRGCCAWARVQIQPYRPAAVRGGGGGVYDGNDAAVVWTRELLRDNAALDAARAQAGNIVGVLLSPPLAAGEDSAIAAGGRTAVTSTELAVLPMAPPLLAANGLMFFEGAPSHDPCMLDVGMLGSAASPGAPVSRERAPS